MGQSENDSPGKQVPGETVMVMVQAHEELRQFNSLSEMALIQDVLVRLCRVGPYQLAGHVFSGDRLCFALTQRNGAGRIRDLVYRFKQESSILFMHEFGKRLWRGGYMDRRLGLPAEPEVVQSELGRFATER